MSAGDDTVIGQEKRTYIPVIGTDTLPAIMTVSTRDELGIGVVPIEASVESRQIIT